MPTGDYSIGLFSRCFIASVVAFIVFSPFYRSWGKYTSWWDAAAGRKVSKILKLLLVIEIVRNIWLFYEVVALGNPIQQTTRDIHYYWTFGTFVTIFHAA